MAAFANKKCPIFSYFFFFLSFIFFHFIKTVPKKMISL